jgi:signal transduction histidine kinase/ActR/RegA family two-component response regulator
MFGSRPAPLRWHLVRLVLLTMIPVVALSAVIALLLWRQQQSTAERGLVDTARAQALVVEREMESAVLALEGLARSDHLDNGNLRAFYDESLRVMRGHPTWATVSLLDREGRMLTNLRRPFGEPLPEMPGDRTFRDVVAGHRPGVTGLLRAAVTGQWSMAVMVPVIRQSTVQYVLMAAIDQPTWAELLGRWQVPPDWFAVLVDQRGIIVARTQSAERFVGAPATAEYRRRSRERLEGVFTQATLEGVDVYVAFARVPTADWSVALAIPAALVDTTPRKLLVGAAGAFAGALGLALLMALFLSRRITRPIARISAAADALGRGGLPAAGGQSSTIVEVENLAATLHRAAVLLTRRSAERDRALQERAQLLLREQRARTEAEAANRSKDEFLAVLSHELRTPLNAILGWIRMLRSDRLDAAQRERALEVIDRNTTLQAQLIDDLLDVSRIVAGKLQLDAHVLDLVDVARQVLDSFARDAAARNVSLDGRLEPGGAIVRGDAVRLQQVLGNLLSNALKFSREGGRVIVTVTRDGDQARLAVTDTGEGIAAEVLPHVFDRFRQADSSSARRQGGLGLGLAIVRHLVELHAGRVRAESPGPGRGATFIVELPLAPDHLAAAHRAETTPAPAATAPRLEDLRVLLVEDEADFRELAANVLREAGAQVAAAGSVAEALILLEGQTIDVLISDLGLPGTDGFALLRSVRAMQSPNGAVAAVALTAFADPDTRARALAAGFRYYATKPITPHQLVGLVARAAGRLVEA